MNIIINGEPKNLSGTTIADMLAEHGYADKVIAVAVNGAFVPKENHTAQNLNDGDQIEIVAPMQGG